jgi:hypothetical protein
MEHGKNDIDKKERKKKLKYKEKYVPLFLLQISHGLIRDQTLASGGVAIHLNNT